MYRHNDRGTWSLGLFAEVPRVVEILRLEDEGPFILYDQLYHGH